jgi:hypothetical protein
MTQKIAVLNIKTSLKIGFSTSVAVTINSNVKQENKAFQKEKISSFNMSTYGRIRTKGTNT